MLNQRIVTYVDELDINDNMKQFIKEILMYEFDTADEINPRYSKFYENLVDKYLRED